MKYYRLYENGESIGDDEMVLGDLIRNKFILKYKFSKKINSYISGELFYLYNIENQPFDEHRISFGLGIDLPKKNSINLFYTFKKEGVADSNEINIIGFNYVAKI